jgi:hypothetical protein
VIHGPLIGITTERFVTLHDLLVRENVEGEQLGMNLTESLALWGPWRLWLKGNAPED